LIENNGITHMNKFKYNLLTDSGGFQMVSLSKLTEINEDHVKFANPYADSNISNINSNLRSKNTDSVNEVNSND